MTPIKEIYSAATDLSNKAFHGANGAHETKQAIAAWTDDVKLCLNRIAAESDFALTR